MIDEKLLQKSQLVILTGLLVLAWLFKLPWLVTGATGLGVAFVLLPRFGRWFSTGWLKLALFLGHWNGRLLLTLVFFLFLT
ncbi:hypothetical protein RZS08_23825, partial [Arthrospira platensis SPKY1]|nr:hypothetical protein [Arthrospira platensis SPKY1]